MSKKIVAAASLSRSEFETFLAGSKAGPASKARYERQWKLEHKERKTEVKAQRGHVAKSANNGTTLPKGREIPSGKAGARPKYNIYTNRRPTEKEVITEKKHYPIGEKRLNVDYKTAKADFAKYSEPTQKRYWSAWEKYHVDTDRRTQEKPSYRIVLSYKARIDGHVMKDSEGKDVRFHWSVADSPKKRLSRKEIEFYAEDIKESTNVQVFDVRAEIAYNNYTGRQV